MEREYIARHIYVKKDSGLEHLIASMQPKKCSEDYMKHSMDSENELPVPEAPEALGYADGSPGAIKVLDGRLQKRSITQTKVQKLSKYPTNIFRNTRCLQDSTTKSSGACQTRDDGTAHGHRIS